MSVRLEPGYLQRDSKVTRRFLRQGNCQSFIGLLPFEFAFVAEQFDSLHFVASDRFDYQLAIVRPCKGDGIERVALRRKPEILPCERLALHVRERARD